MLKEKRCCDTDAWEDDMIMLKNNMISNERQKKSF